jgi:hypothetical protein
MDENPTNNVVDFQAVLRTKEFGEVYDKLVDAFQSCNDKYPNLSVENFIIISNSISGQLYHHVGEGNMKTAFVEGISCQLWSLNKVREKNGLRKLTLKELLS